MKEPSAAELRQIVRGEFQEIPGLHLTQRQAAGLFLTSEDNYAHYEHDRRTPDRDRVLLFLRNFRSTLIVATSIPISVIGTFALLYFAGMTLNTMTFGGLALGVGMVVDAAIVVLENSFRHMEEHGKDRMTAAIDGSEEVWSAILASILTGLGIL